MPMTILQVYRALHSVVVYGSDLEKFRQFFMGGLIEFKMWGLCEKESVLIYDSSSISTLSLGFRSNSIRNSSIKFFAVQICSWAPPGVSCGIPKEFLLRFFHGFVKDSLRSSIWNFSKSLS